MTTVIEANVAEKRESTLIQWYDIPYPASAYTFPQEALIHQISFDEQTIRFELTDGRLLAVPLAWIPSLYNAPPQERLKYQISRDRKTVIWDPDQCAINEDLRIDDYLRPRPTPH